MKNNVIIYLLIFFLWNCEKEDYEKRPKKAIPKVEFAHIVADIIVLKNIKVKHLKENGILPMDLILNKYCIDSTTLRDNITYYSSNPNLMLDIVKNADSIIKLKKHIIKPPVE